MLLIHLRSRGGAIDWKMWFSICGVAAGSSLSGSASLPHLPAAGRVKNFAAGGFFHWRPCAGHRVFHPDARCDTLPNLLPKRATHQPRIKHTKARFADAPPAPTPPGGATTEVRGVKGSRVTLRGLSCDTGPMSCQSGENNGEATNNDKSCVSAL